MNGAETLLRTLLVNGVDVCFANPGTSEMQFVAALDRHPAMRGVLCLFEGAPSSTSADPTSTSVRCVGRSDRSHPCSA
jgi:acetolactate synthase-1/2/3 large subunit